MAGTLRDDLASLKIDRQGRDRPAATSTRPRRRERGLGFLALLVWLIPVGLLGFAGVYVYRQYEQIRGKTEVSVGLVQLSMTSGEAEKLFKAPGLPLKARHQADIGA